MGLQANPAPGNVNMAIFSLHHSSIGKTTQAKPHTAAAHVRYVTRSSAASRIEARRMPEKPHKAAAFMVEAENPDRKNARVSDKLMLALPRELNGEQRAQLVREFAEEVTEGRAPWLAAFHDRGKDAQNPHAHLVIRDRDPETGKRVAGLSEKGTTERLRRLWEEHANRALQSAGREERIDRRTLEAQGIEREATVHEGPKAQQMDRRGARARSRMRRYRNRPGSRRSHREIDYEAIDGGRSRPDYNRGIREDSPAAYWEVIDADDQARELAHLRLIHHPAASVDLTLVTGAPADEARRGIMNEGGTVLARLDKSKVDEKVTHPPREITKEPPDLSHEVFYYKLNIGGKGMAGDKRLEKLQREIEDVKERIARQDRKFNTLLDESYEDSNLAHTKMDSFLEKHGYQELLAAIRADGNEFGPPPADPGRRNDAGKHRSELYVALSDSWELADEYDELKAALERLQAQQGAGAASTMGAGTGQQVQQEVKSQAATTLSSAPKQKTPAEIQAHLAGMNAQRAEAVARARGFVSEIDKGSEPKPGAARTPVTQSAQQGQQEAKPQAPAAPSSAPKQKSPAEIQAYLAAMNAKRAADQQKKASAGSQSEVEAEDGAEPK